MDDVRWIRNDTGLPAAVGFKEHTRKTIIDIAGSFVLITKEMSTAVQYRLPIKIFI